MKRAFALLLGAALILVPTAGSQAAERLILLLDWFINPDHAPIIVAKEKGLFAREGLEVEIVAPADPNDPPKLVAAGQADVAVDYQPQLHLQVDQGLPLVRIGTLIGTPLTALVVLADSEIRTIEDFKGRRIGYSVAGFEDALLNAMLASGGLAPNDVELVNVNFALSPSLLAGQVDGVMGAYRNFELNQLEIEGRPGRAFYPEELGVPAFDELIFVTHRNLISDPRMPRFLDAIEAATLYLLNHPKESFELFLKGRPELDNELNRRAWEDTLPRFASRPAALDRSRYERFAAFLRAQDLIQSEPDVSSYAIEVPRPR